jgi:dethiobiotin synthetase
VIRVYCVGTATDIGKTWFGAATLTELRRRGLRVAARKPVQSFDPAAPGPTDADVLAAATDEQPHDVCPGDRWYELPLAPPMAADRLGRRCPGIAELAADAVDRIDEGSTDVAWIEGVGGPRSPIAADGDGADLAAALQPDLLVLVADPGLGTINAVRLCADALGPCRVERRGAEVPLVVALNRYDHMDELHRANHAWLTERDRLDIVTSPTDRAASIRARRPA